MSLIFVPWFNPHKPSRFQKEERVRSGEFGIVQGPTDFVKEEMIVEIWKASCNQDCVFCV